ncbi:MAG TPA: hypothetical protein VMM78_02980 [Thermomicrobiales bacterium]|nr:hypothetical protein [Thermomicrobiales bacterium]
MWMKTPDGAPLGMVVQDVNLAGRRVCIDVLIDDTGQAVPVPVPCDSE